jgi:small-conductance mechanosensitive channel
MSSILHRDGDSSVIADRQPKTYDRSPMNWDLQGWPASARTALLSLLIIAGAYVIGRVASHVAAKQLSRLARRTGSRWIDAVVEAVARRVPFWSLLVGIYIAAGFWILPEKIANALDKGLYVVAAASLTFLASEVLVRLVRTHGPTIDPSLPTTTLTENLVRIVVVIVGLLVILAGLDLEITPILTALGVGGLAVALALQDTLANLFAGFYLTVAKHIRIGNYIKLSSGEEGYLVDIDWRASRLRQLTNNTVLVPNVKLSQSIITNYHSPDHEMAVTIEASVDYVSDLDRVERIVTEVARDVMRTVQGGVPGFDPLVRFHTFGDPRIGFSVILRAREFVDQYLIKHEFVKRLQKRFLAEGITIPIKSLVQRQDAPPPPP